MRRVAPSGNALNNGQEERRVEDRRADSVNDSLPTEQPFSGDGCNNEASEVASTALCPVSANQPTTQSQQLNLLADRSALEKTGNTMADEHGKKELTPKEQARLSSLKSMLESSNARYQQATRKRRPVFAAGLTVMVVQGEFAGKLGVVVDADYIENRALVSLPEQDSPRWIGFRSLGHAD